MLYHGPLCNTTLPPSTFLCRESLSLRLSLSTSDRDISPLSDAVVVELERAGLTPGPPRDLHVIGCTASQVRLSWTAPKGEQKLKGYHIYCGNTQVDTTTEPGWVSLLKEHNWKRIFNTPSQHNISMCAYNCNHDTHRPVHMTEVVCRKLLFYCDFFKSHVVMMQE